jgi:hypothetical protein
MSRFPCPHPVTLSLILAALTAGTACSDPPPVKEPTNTGDVAEQGKIAKSRAKIDEASSTYTSKNYEKARQLLREASALAVESHRFEIEELSEKVDKRHAKLWSNEVSERFEKKDCTGAFKELSAQMDGIDSEAFTREIRRLTAEPALKCLTAQIDEQTTGGNYAAARKLIEAPEAKAVLGPAAIKKIAAELETTIDEAMSALVADDIKAKKWADAIAKFDAAVKKGDAEASRAGLILKAVHDGIAPEIAAIAVKGVGHRDAAAMLKQIDQMIALVRWEVMTPEAAELQKDKALPEDLRKKRQVLAIFVEGQRAGLKPNKKPDQRWTHGKIALLPAEKIAGESKRDLQNSTQVWVIGVTKDKALIAEQNPGEGAIGPLLDKAVGWVPLLRLARKATIDWIPPEDQLKGARVWGPLRPPDAQLELGVVSDVKGKDAVVKRSADDKEITVPIRSLRNGRLAPGTKVLTFCTAKDQPAKIEEALPNGRAVKLKCDSGEVKEELLPSLRTKSDLLPPSQ